MYAKASEVPIAQLPEGYERADDATLAGIGIYHIREVYPDFDEETETIDRESYEVSFDAEAEPLPVYVMIYGKRPMTEDEITARQDEIEAQQEESGL